MEMILVDIIILFHSNLTGRFFPPGRSRSQGGYVTPSALSGDVSFPVSFSDFGRIVGTTTTPARPLGLSNSPTSFHYDELNSVANFRWIAIGK